jgi:hypothetical protein
MSSDETVGVSTSDQTLLLNFESDHGARTFTMTCIMNNPEVLDYDQVRICLTLIFKEY